MSKHVLVRKTALRKPFHSPPPVRPKRVGTQAQVAVQVDPILGTPGADLAAQVGATAQADYDRVWALFGLRQRVNVIVSIERLSEGSDGSGGAWHETCQDTTLHVDASFGNPGRTSALFIAELVEVFSALQAGGWNCGATNGEGLSRVVAEWAYPGALDDYECFSSWLDSVRPNWIDANEATDEDDLSNGCAVGFLWWLQALGVDLPAICAAPGTSLAATYAALGKGTSAWPDFQKACAALWPAGRPSGVTNDNPWPAGGGGGGNGGGGGGGGGNGGTPGASLTLAQNLPAGDYLVVPVTAVMREAVKQGYSLGAIAHATEKALSAFLDAIIRTPSAQKKPQ